MTDLTQIAFGPQALLFYLCQLNLLGSHGTPVQNMAEETFSVYFEAKQRPYFTTQASANSHNQLDLRTEEVQQR